MNKHLPQVLDGFLPFRIFNHTDLHREKFERAFESVKNEDVIIDEAHHFRNRGRRSLEDKEKRSRYFRMLELTAGKQVFLLTATPINNRLLDLKHLIDLFAQEDDQHFKDIGIRLQWLFQPESNWKMKPSCVKAFQLLATNWIWVWPLTCLNRISCLKSGGSAQPEICQRQPFDCKSGPAFIPCA